MIELVEPQRYESQKQAIRGRVELVGPGMVLLIWDNSFSWLNTKQLAYSIELTQDTPEASEERKTALAQRARLERERALLAKDMELSQLLTTLQSQEQTIAFVKHQIEELTQTLAKSEDEKTALEALRDGVEEQLDTLVWEIDGVCAHCSCAWKCKSLTDADVVLLRPALSWRAMDKPVVHRMLSFVEETDRVAWYTILQPQCLYDSDLEHLRSARWLGDCLWRPGPSPAKRGRRESTSSVLQAKTHSRVTTPPKPLCSLLVRSRASQSLCAPWRTSAVLASVQRHLLDRFDQLPVYPPPPTPDAPIILNRPSAHAQVSGSPVLWRTSIL